MNPEPDLPEECFLFQFLDDRERSELVGQLQSVRFSAGETVFKIGEPGEALYVIHSRRAESCSRTTPANASCSKW